MIADPGEPDSASAPAGLTPLKFVVVGVACAGWTGAVCGLLTLPDLMREPWEVGAPGDDSFLLAFEMGLFGAFVGGAAGLGPVVAIALTPRNARPLRWSGPAAAAALAVGVFATAMFARDPFAALGLAVVGMVLGFAFDAAAASRGIRPWRTAIMVGAPSGLVTIAAAGYRFLGLGAA